jgi:hypothetical protein
VLTYIIVYQKLISVDVFIMHISIKAYHTKPTYEELTQEAVVNPTETIKYPNRFATQLRTTPQLTRFDDELF